MGTKQKSNPFLFAKVIAAFSLRKTEEKKIHRFPFQLRLFQVFLVFG
jgi:hypothetical protein